MNMNSIYLVKNMKNETKNENKTREKIEENLKAIEKLEKKLKKARKYETVRRLQLAIESLKTEISIYNSFLENKPIPTITCPTCGEILDYATNITTTENGHACDKCMNIIPEPIISNLELIYELTLQKFTKTENETKTKNKTEINRKTENKTEKLSHKNKKILLEISYIDSCELKYLQYLQDNF